MPISRRDGKKAKILYIEDNRENRMLVRAVLEAEGYRVVDAEDGLSGIEAAIREEPALILLHVNLPAIDGYEVVAVIKSFPAFATTPVIAVTAYAMEGDRQRTLVAGCDGYIQKPIDVDAFPRQVEEFLHGKREWIEDDWTLPLAVRGRSLGVMTARHILPPGAKADEEQLLNIVANQVAIAVENARLYDGVVQRAAEQQSLVEAGHLLASSLRLADVLQRFTELVRSRVSLDVV